MKNTGIVRKLDELGRITLPKELRNTYGIGEKDPLEIYTENGTIVLKPVKEPEKECAFCGADHDLIEIDKSFACLPCAYRLRNKLLRHEGSRL